jgi:RNA recognition motif-containing protein
MKTRLYVGGISFETSEQELSQLFGQVGEVVSCRLITDRETGQSRGFAFVEMASEAATREAMTQYEGYELGGRRLRVSEARERTGRVDGGGGSARRN